MKISIKLFENPPFKQFSVNCRWVNPCDEIYCQYACFVPEFLEKHIYDEIDMYWIPNLWKKGQILKCHWQGLFSNN